MTATVEEKNDLALFVKCKTDNYRLDPCKFHISARITRRAGNSEAWERTSNGSHAARIDLSRAPKTLQLLNLAEITQ